ncbi:NADH:flavin oxidoreductase/NADH oxidase [Natronobacterium gregoryi]|uniref:NADH:flavin oxidoreductase n=2 Tax=Natronobacterium gregoryi TaxID=44930 RepID=L0ADJ9_NATGS|nr:NADH:flavin oxidoreductase/NADH oxidase [Natronobacterium gregoryi]AFZ71509.1 NADH:flavin oxidoreductase [Natronobacterium gregoryi SP2]ELY66565.1 NADPH dehydrogenase [Natronobacterium gregoryi SP2]PLK21283.1 NADH:flavin oxidoreductase/NADH oxidase [Natronobacterium gregoryi SP2]SFI83114.1 2,4-dienoyl-CoA reductase [Natronobacterium gregoryi]
MPALFSELAIRDCEIPNRIAVSPMCQYSCGPDGLPTEWHRVHLGSRAVGGAGIVLTEATAVEPRGRITAHDLGIWNDEQAEALRPITQFVREQGGVPAIQLAHAGHKASKTRPWDGNDPIAPDETDPDGATGWEVLSPSPDAYPPFSGDRPAMRKATQDDIEDVIDDYRNAAERSLEAGFEIAEVHAAHGYLLHEFLSPVTNHREDDYGGSFENRTRLFREVTAAVRDVWPDGKPVFVRLSGTDWLEDRPSWDIDQSVRLADDLADLGVDLIDVSSGGIHPAQKPPGGPNFQVPLAEAIREETQTEIAVGAVGGITEPAQAEALVRNDRADLVLVGREFLREPYFGLRAAGELEDDAPAKWPVQYRRSVR